MRVKICMENGGRIEFITKDDCAIPYVEGSWLVVENKENGKEQFLISGIVAFSCWFRPARHI